MPQPKDTTLTDEVRKHIEAALDALPQLRVTVDEQDGRNVVALFHLDGWNFAIFGASAGGSAAVTIRRGAGYCFEATDAETIEECFAVIAGLGEMLCGS